MTKKGRQAEKEKSTNKKLNRIRRKKKRTGRSGGSGKDWAVMMPIPENGGGAARGDENQRALALSLALELRKAREVGALPSHAVLTDA